jgi:ribonuclease P protein component
MRSGVRRFSESFIFFLKASGRPHARLGVTVSRKVGGAVVRNRVKRLVREAFRLHPHWFRQPLDVVVIAKRELRVHHLCRHDVEREFEHVLRHHFRGHVGQPGRSGARGGSRRVGADSPR